MKVKFLKQFDKEYKKLDKISQKQIDKAIRLYFNNPQPKSLRLKKIVDSNGIFEMSANMDLRVTYHFEKPDIIVFRNCGHHNKVLKNP